MPASLALPILFDAVIARFAADAAAGDPPLAPVPNVFGWREPAKLRRASHRIVWVPGDDATGAAAAEIGPARQPGRNPRPLATVYELATVYVEALDVNAPEDERAQYEAARELFDLWWRAVHLAAYGTVTLRALAWVNATKERRAGAALRAVLAIEAPVVDLPAAIAPADTSALIEVEILDHAETMETAPPAP